MRSNGLNHNTVACTRPKPPLVALILLIPCVLPMLLAGCAGGDVLYLSTYPSGPLRAGDTFQFAATMNGAPATSGVGWTVKGGTTASEMGSITRGGLYAAASSLEGPITVTVEAELDTKQVISEIPVQILPAVPAITEASADVLSSGPLDLEIAGANLLPQTVALLNGTPQTMKYLTPTTASISGTIPQGVAVASIELQNPWDEDSSAPLVLPIQSPPSNPPTGGASAASPLGLVSGLTGCNNPNIGLPSNDWGSGTNPVYVGPQGIVVNTPSYASNSLFWISRETGPGQSVLMTGAFTGAKKTVRVAVIPAGTVNWQSLVESSRAVVPATQQGTTGLSFIVPSTFPPGVYGFEIDDPGTSAIQGLANVPNINWAIGVPAAVTPAAPLQNQVHDCGAEVGGTLHLFGKNFVAADDAVLQASDGTIYPLKPATADTNSMSVELPEALAPGTYNIWVGSPAWDATSSAIDQIVIFQPQQLSTKSATCGGLIGDGVTDNSAALQACLDTYAPAAGSGVAAYLTIPSGTFALNEGVVGHPYEVLAGASSQTTQLIGRPKGTPPPAWITVPQHFGIVGISVTAPADPYLVASSTMGGDPLSCGHIFFDDVRLESTADFSNGGEMLAALSGPDIQVYNSFFLSGSNQAFALIFGDGAVISGNEFVLNNLTGLSITNSQNVEFKDNLIHSYDPLHQYGQYAGSGLAINRANSQYGVSAVSQDIYAGYNDFEDMGSADQQAITNDGDGGAYLGPIAASTADTVALADAPAWNWMGTTNPQASAIAIISGTGVGQYSLIKGYSGSTISLVTPWKVMPDSSSVVAITQYQLNVTIAHNSFTDVAGCSICLVDSLEGAVEDNQLGSDTAGILVGAYGPYGGPAGYGPSIDMDVLRNSTPWLVIQDMPGCLLSGVLIRDNVVPAPGNIQDTDGDAGVSAVLIEQNQATWDQTWFYTPGFLVQDNLPPP